MDKVRIGIIGAGTIAKRHLGNLLALPNAQVTAIADLRLDQARALAEGCGARAYQEYREMLDRERLDGVYICVPPFAHGAPELAVIDRRLPFFVEKPISIDLAMAEEIAGRVAEHGLITAVGYHWRYLDTVERAREMLARNPARLVQGYWLDSTPPPAWWIKQPLSGGQMVEQTTHIFDLSRHLVGEVTRIYAAGARSERPGFPEADIWDVSTVTLHFASGALGTISSTCLLGWPHRVGLHLFGDGLAIELSEHEMMVDVGRGRPIEPAQGDPMLREDRDFVDAVQGQTSRIRVPYAEALKTQRLTATATRSVIEGRPLDVPSGAAHG